MVVVAVRDAQGEAGTGHGSGRGKRRKKINWAGKARISDLNLPPHCAPPGDDLSGRPLDRDEMAKTHSGHDASFRDLRPGAVGGGGGCAGRGVARNACAMQVVAARREKRVGDWFRPRWMEESVLFGPHPNRDRLTKHARPSVPFLDLRNPPAEMPSLPFPAEDAVTAAAGALAIDAPPSSPATISVITSPDITSLPRGTPSGADSDTARHMRPYKCLLQPPRRGPALAVHAHHPFAAAHASRDRQSGAPDFVSRGLDSPRGRPAPPPDRAYLNLSRSLT
ncbi:hypothetical protein IEO21_08516 [Rhodonia placenta]|uniref:Uncharacterized protein n=1 Tax=Rhodonia placenta TaxID=104341 RepID=A0A8H7TYM6_9APHY|nr:hypothetical protein IEO21_08516 [Postia placenta]